MGIRRTSLLSASLVALTAAAQATAQTPSATTPSDSNAAPVRATGGGASSDADIIVTARRVEERLQDVPISITVFNQQQLANRNVVNASDLARYTPSLSVNTNFGSDNTTFAIRGFNQDTGSAPSVGVYFADVVAPRAASNGIVVGDGAGAGSFFDLANVQVLKGPQGTLFGRNTTGGAILLVPQKPTSKTEGYVEGSYGNYDMQRIQAVFNTPLGDLARFRIGIDHQTRDGYIINDSGIGTHRYGNVDYTAVRASLVVDLTPNLENYTIASYSRSDTHGPVQKLIACNAGATGGLLGGIACGQIAAQAANPGFDHLLTNFGDSYSRLTQWQVINTTTWRASDTLSIKNIASYSELRQAINAPLFGTDFSAPNGAPVGFASVGRAPHYDGAAESTFTEEFQIQGNTTNDRLTYQGGVYVEQSDPLGQSGTEAPTLLNCTNPGALQCTDPFGVIFSQMFGVPIHVGGVNVNLGQTSFRDFGAYAQATYALTDRLKLTGGIRYTRDHQFAEVPRFNITFPVTPPFDAAPVPNCSLAGATLPSCDLPLSKRSAKPTWLADIDYKPTDDILVYAKYSRGYRAGGVFPNAPQQFRTFDPEKVDAYEAGLKTSFRGPVSGTFDVSGFYNNFSDQQLQLGFGPNQAVFSSAAPTTALINAGKSRIYGAEVEASINPFRGFNVQGSYTYLDTRVRRIATVTLSPTDPYVLGGGISVGDPLALSPKNKVSVTGTYQLPLDPAAGKLSVGATFTHSDRQLVNYSDIAAADPAIQKLSYLKPTNLLNLNLNWNGIAGSRIDASLFATNVTNRKYYSYVAGLYTTTGFETATLGEPRMFGGRLRYRFGG
jgi:iron complex outermembrane receptor protein